ncbi:HPP family protein [Moritella sp. Urea-trap-13]|uniref:HPP family protein n=1 Tax=Moritella sp. Urea-trap-13 TaxID=2058327 RepID=UPI000C32C4DE|nr:HPP family protein [Moritella sp. Urea-trap-13]PKH06829.1 HPP family protein [Moritella sp. Urea-trap-13]
MNHIIFSLIAGTFATLTIGVLAYLDSVTSATFWLMAPFGASVVLVFGVPKSPLAQPKNVIIGHFLTALIGVLFVEYVGVSPWSLALATGLAVSVMLLTKTTHPPAGANPMLIMLSGQSWAFLFSPVLIGACIIVCLGLVLNKLRLAYFERT